MDSSENNGNDSNKYAEQIKSTKNNLKINIDGFLYVISLPMHLHCI